MFGKKKENAIDAEAEVVSDEPAPEGGQHLPPPPPPPDQDGQPGADDAGDGQQQQQDPGAAQQTLGRTIAELVGVGWAEAMERYADRRGNDELRPKEEHVQAVIEAGAASWERILPAGDTDNPHALYFGTIIACSSPMLLDYVQAEVWPAAMKWWQERQKAREAQQAEGDGDAGQ